MAGEFERHSRGAKEMSPFSNQDIRGLPLSVPPLHDDVRKMLCDVYVLQSPHWLGWLIDLTKPKGVAVHCLGEGYIYRQVRRPGLDHCEARR